MRTLGLRYARNELCRLLGLVCNKIKQYQKINSEDLFSDNSLGNKYVPGNFWLGFWFEKKTGKNVNQFFHMLQKILSFLKKNPLQTLG